MNESQLAGAAALVALIMAIVLVVFGRTEAAAVLVAIAAVEAYRERTYR